MTQSSMVAQAEVATAKGKQKGKTAAPPDEPAETPPPPAVEIDGRTYRVRPVENSAPILLAIHEAGARNIMRIFDALDRLLIQEDREALCRRIDAGELSMEEVSAAVVKACRVMLDRPTS